MTRFLLVEDERPWQAAVSQLLQTVPSWELAAVTDHYAGALREFEATQPDVVLLDWKILGAQDGLAVGEALQQQGFPVERIVFISGADLATIPHHPYVHVPKTQLANRLVETLQEILKT